MAYAMVAIGAVGSSVWAHHSVYGRPVFFFFFFVFFSRSNPRVNFVFATMVIAVRPREDLLLDRNHVEWIDHLPHRFSGNRLHLPVPRWLGVTGVQLANAGLDRAML